MFEIELCSKLSVSILKASITGNLLHSLSIKQSAPFVNWKKPLSHVEMYFFHKCNGINQGMYKNRVELGKVSKCYILTYLIFRFCHLYLLILKDIKEWGFQKSLLFFTLFYTYPGTIAMPDPDYLGSIDKSIHNCKSQQFKVQFIFQFCNCDV